MEVGNLQSYTCIPVIFVILRCRFAALPTPSAARLTAHALMSNVWVVGAVNVEAISRRPTATSTTCEAPPDVLVHDESNEEECSVPEGFT